MKVAVITPVHNVPSAWLDECLASVANQSVLCTHFLVFDGEEPPAIISQPGVLVLRIPGPHRDAGNAARAIGSVSAISRGFDAIAYLDADNWYEPDHLRHLCDAHQLTGAPVCSARRTLYDVDGNLLGPCPEVDGKRFVDTNCLFLTRQAFGIVAAWYLMPPANAPAGDRIVWKAVKQAKLKRVHVTQATVNYRTRYAVHYRYFGKQPPPSAKPGPVHLPARPELAQLDAERLYRWEDRMGGTARTAKLPRPPLPTPQGPPPKVSLCMIARNEESTLAACLRSVADLVSEMIVVDTGSTDRTKEVALECGAKVFEFPWIDDFAAARNESLRHASGDWILWLDADESFDEENRERLKRLFGMLTSDRRVYMMKQWSLPELDNGSALVVDHARLFPNLPGVGWRFRIHEQILPALREAGLKIAITDIALRHVGYQQRSVRQHKLERNLRLLHLEHKERPEEAFTLFNLGGTYLDAGEPEKAMTYLRQCVETAHRGATFLPKSFVLLAQVERSRGRLKQGLEWCKQGQANFPKEPELWFEEGLLRQANKDLAGARHCFEQIFKLPKRPCYVGTDTGIRGHLARHQLATILREQKCLREAMAQWRAAVKANPQFGPAWLGLAELCLEVKRPAAVQSMIDQLATRPESKAISLVLRWRLCLAQGQHDAACEHMREAIAHAPLFLWPRLLYCDMLIRNNADLEEAEHQLSEVLTIDPRQKRVQERLEQIQKKRAESLVGAPA
jgi:glycosyltransferase involved in cell wall biosynthesis